MTSRKVLIVSTVGGIKIAHLHHMLKAAGMEVCIACPGARPRNNMANKIYALGYLHMASDLRHAIADSNPYVIIPSDDRAVGYLHKIYRDHKGKGPIAQTIERSLGSPEYYDITLDKGAQAETAKELKISTPRTWTRIDRATYDNLNLSFHHVLKKPTGTCGGDGVRIIRSPQDIDKAWNDLCGPRSVKTELLFPLLKYRNLRPLQNWLEWSNELPLVQEFIEGAPAHCAAFCVNGQLKAITGVKVLKSKGPTGVASVVELIDNPEMEKAAEILIRSLGLSGLCGFDFIIDENRKAILLEVTARDISAAKLSFAGRTSPAVALCTYLLGREVQETNIITKPIVAFFPHNDKDALIETYGEDKIHFLPPYAIDGLDCALGEEEIEERWKNLYDPIYEFKHLPLRQKAARAVRLIPRALGII